MLSSMLLLGHEQARHRVSVRARVRVRVRVTVRVGVGIWVRVRVGHLEAPRLVRAGLLDKKE